MRRAEPAPVVLVGRGLIGEAVRALLLAAGQPVVTVSRSGHTSARHRRHDLLSQQGRSRLRADLQRLRPQGVVLTHGPSDVTWIERHESEAAAAHRGVAEVAASCEAPTIFISTDNVFPGARGFYRADDPIGPGNAYGRMKADAESLLLASGHALVLRVSLVYGWTSARHRDTYAERCLRAAHDRRALLAPVDQTFTPIHIADVATVVAAVVAAWRGAPITGPRRPTGHRPLTGVRHLAGPGQLSRHEFARLAYQLAGVDPELVRPVCRRDTELASRPEFSSLQNSDYTDLSELASWRPMAPADGLREMLAERPLASLGER